MITVLACILGGVSVALGAYGAHGLDRLLAGDPEIAKRIDWWKTATHYLFMHALALFLTGLVVKQTSTPLLLAPGLFIIGMLVFSGSLYAMALGAPRFFGAITPIGGLALILAWATLAWSAWKTT